MAERGLGVAVGIPGLALDGVPLFDRFRFQLEAGRWTCLLGPSGIGKTSFAAHLAANVCRRGLRCLYFALEESAAQIALRANVTISGYAQPEKSKKGEVTWVVPGLDPIHFVFPRPAVTTVTSSYASQGARQNALAIDRAVQYHLRRRIELPKGTRVVRAPGPLRYRPRAFKNELSHGPTWLSSALRIARTPGTARAALRSTRRIRACGWALRTNRQWRASSIGMFAA